ncbi:MAG: hypothetical protein JWR61_4698 [Ferruginibacter sp.]|nr:hypothetical protein [Ferruginibacter sp.]
MNFLHLSTGGVFTEANNNYKTITMKPQRRRELQTVCGHASYSRKGDLWKAVLAASGFHGKHMLIAGLSCENPASTERF